MNYQIVVRTIIITLVAVIALGIVGNVKYFNTPSYSFDESEELPKTFNLHAKHKQLEISHGKITLLDSTQNTILSQDCTSLILNRHFSLEGPIVAAKPFHACDKIENTHLITNTTIVLVSDYWGISLRLPN